MVGVGVFLLLLELVLVFLVFVLLVVVVILGVPMVLVSGDTSITGSKCNAYCPYILYASCR